MSLILTLSNAPSSRVSRALLIGSACLAVSNGFANAEGTQRAEVPAKHLKLLQDHCQSCHGPEKQKGSFRIDTLPLHIKDLPTAERWQKVLNAMNSGEMPPEEEKQPDKKLKADLLEDLANGMVLARKTLSDQRGVIALRRLNRREYRNTLHDLLGVQVDVSELPSDTGAPNFDTVGASLFITSTQIEQYETLGREALEEAFKLREAASRKHIQRVEIESLQPVFEKRNIEGISARDRALAWIQAVDAAISNPNNAKIVSQLRKIASSDDLLRYHWKKIPGAPSPIDFGFDKVWEVNPAGIYLHRDQTEFIRYDEYYRSLPHLDRGGYLTVQSRIGGGNNVLSIPSLSIPLQFPTGDYVLRVRIAAVDGASPERRFLEFGLKGFAGSSTPASSIHHITGTMEAPQILEIPFTFTQKNADQKHRNLFIRERGFNDGRHEQRLKEAHLKNGFGPTVALWVDWMEIEHKPLPPGELPPGLKALNLPLDAQATPLPEAQLNDAFERFALEAYRGAVAPKGLSQRLLGIYRSRQALGDNHREALKHALASVLSSPRFLYRAEPSENGEHRRLTPPELATRLSYFLAGGPPDAELRTLASSGELLQPQVLRQQTERLLAHPNATRFIKPFLTQWLSLDRLDLFQFSKTLYPRFDDSMRAAARQEVYETFSALLRDNGSLSDLLDANYAMVNALLAEYYDLPGVTGDHFQKVRLPEGSPRGGLLGMAAILAMGSNGQKTNPVERGAWVLRKLLNDPPPPAPANVPEISRLAGKALTTRERLQAHQEEPQCTSCHRKIDPIGFGLENFDAAGQWRTKDTYQGFNAAGKPDPTIRKTWTIDASAKLHKGPAFNSYHELKALIAERRQNFARGFTAALIEFALGRPCGFSDAPLVDLIVQQAEDQSFAARSFIHALVQSKDFQSK